MEKTFITDEATQVPSEFIAIAQRFSLASVELRSVYGEPISALGPPQLRALREDICAAGLRVCCISSSVFKSFIENGIKKEIQKLRRVLDVANFLGSPLVRIFSFWRHSNRSAHLNFIHDSLEYASEFAREAQVKLAIENGKRTMHATGQELAELLDTLSPSVFSAVWDPANCLFGGFDENPLTVGYPCIAKYIGHVHLKDVRVYSKEHREYVPLGAGDLGIGRQLALLATDNYRGALSVETHWRPDRAIADSDLDYPGGEQFSQSGYSATTLCLARLQKLCESLRADIP